MALSRFAGQYSATSFNYGGLGVDNPPALVVVNGSNAASTGSTLTVQNGFFTASDGTVITPFNTNAPVSIINAAGADTQTPSAVSTNVQNSAYGLTATVTATTWTYAHAPGDRVSSGTVGLQEAINYANLKGGGQVIIDASWVTQGGTQAILDAATVPSTVQIVDNRSGQDGVAQTLTVAIPNASVLTLSSVGYQLLPAPGAGNMYIVDRIVVEQVAKTGAFAGSPGNMTAAYGTQSSQVAATGTIAGTILTGGSGTTNQIGMALGVAPANGNSSVLLNSAIGLYVATNDPTTGAGSLIVKISYRTLTGF